MPRAVYRCPPKEPDSITHLRWTPCVSAEEAILTQPYPGTSTGGSTVFEKSLTCDRGSSAKILAARPAPPLGSDRCIGPCWRGPGRYRARPGVVDKMKSSGGSTSTLERFTPNCSPIRRYAPVQVGRSFPASFAICITRSRNSIRHVRCPGVGTVLPGNRWILQTRDDSALPSVKLWPAQRWAFSLFAPSIVALR
jgi:hypothetical protein